MRYAVVLPVFLLFFLCSCNQHRMDEPGTIVVGVEAFPATLDPRLAIDALSSKICRLLYNGLFKLDDHLQIVPDLAESFSYAGDTLLEIRLKPDVFFHNGKKLGPEDIVATINSIRHGELSSPYRSNFDVISHIEVSNETSLRIFLKKPFAPLLTSLTLGILPMEIAEGTFEPVGTGPYRMEEILDREKVVLRRFENFFGPPQKNDRLVFRTIFDDTLRALELIHGRLDLVQNAIPQILLETLSKRNHLKITTGPGINFSYIGFNLKDPVLKIKEVRRALAMSVNREELVHYKLKDMAYPAASMLIPNHWAANIDLKDIEYNPEMARNILDKSGFTDPDSDGPRTRFSLVYKTSTKKDRVELALLIAEQLKKVGVEVFVKPFEWGTFFRDIRVGNFQIYSLTWVGLTDPDIYFLAFHSSQVPPHGANRGYYINKELDQILEMGRETVDMEKRKGVYQKVQEIVFDEMPIVPLWYENNWVVANRKVKGYSLRPDAGFQNLVNAYKE